MIEPNWKLIEEFLQWEIYLDASKMQYWTISPNGCDRYGPAHTRADLKLIIQRKKKHTG